MIMEDSWVSKGFIILSSIANPMLRRNKITNNTEKNEASFFVLKPFLFGFILRKCLFSTAHPLMQSSSLVTDMDVLVGVVTPICKWFPSPLYPIPYYPSLPPPLEAVEVPRISRRCRESRRDASSSMLLFFYSISREMDPLMIGPFVDCLYEWNVQLALLQTFLCLLVASIKFVPSWHRAPTYCPLYI